MEELYDRLYTAAKNFVFVVDFNGGPPSGYYLSYNALKECVLELKGAMEYGKDIPQEAD